MTTIASSFGPMLDQCMVRSEMLRLSGCDSVRRGLRAGAVKPLLVAEIILQRRQAHAGRLRDPARRHLFERGLAERFKRRVENTLPGLFPLAIAGARDRAHLWGFGRGCFLDHIAAAAAGILIGSTMAVYAIAAHIPVIRDAADRSLVRKLTRQIARYGHAEFTTNAATYRPAHT